MNPHLVLLNLEHPYTPCNISDRFQLKCPPPSDVNGKALKQFLKNFIHHCSVQEVKSITNKQNSTTSLSIARLGRLSSILPSLTASKNLNQSTEDEILRYIRVTDQYIALSSLLLKSWAFHQYCNRSNSTTSKLCSTHTSTQGPRNIFILPRSQGKPYIPHTDTEENWPPDISISHQYPFVGLAITSCVLQESHSSHDSSYKRDTKDRIGLDIVMFDSHVGVLERLCNYSLTDFLETYRQYFTSWEWDQIVSSSPSSDYFHNHIHGEAIQFYLRWAMKEAYTKALGVGLGLRFSSFEIREDVSMGGCAFSNCIQSKEYDKPSPILSHVHYLDSNHTVESWTFYFIPLMNKGESSPNIVGCACVCLPHDETSEAVNPLLSLSNLTLSQLIEYHTNMK